MSEKFFIEAKPIWIWDREREMNLHVGFKAVFDKPAAGVMLSVAACNLYRIYVNGLFGGYGPARAAHDWYRVDKWDITRYLKERDNVVVIEVAGYNCNAFYVLDQPAFLQAEIMSDNTVIAATSASGKGFTARVLTERVRKVKRYNLQRAFLEAYRFNSHNHGWRTSTDTQKVHILAEMKEKRLLPRRISYPLFTQKFPVSIYAKGAVQKITEHDKSDLTAALLMLPPETPQAKVGQFADELKGKGYTVFMVNATPDGKGTMVTVGATEFMMDALASRRDIAGVGFDYYADESVTLNVKSFSGDELELCINSEIKAFKSISQQILGDEYKLDKSNPLSENQFIIYQFEKVVAGFLGIEFSCKEKTKFILLHDELLVDGDVHHARAEQMTNAVIIEAEPGEYHIDCFEAYSYKYVKVIASEGALDVKNLYVREYTNPDSDNFRFQCSDEKLQVIFEASRENLRQNTMDSIMDVTNRERTSYLGDSTFTAQGIFALTGNTTVETSFLEDFLLAKEFDKIPKGMIPCAYPAEQDLGIFIPNYAMWLAVQLEHYLERSGNREMVDSFKDKIYNLYDYLSKFKSGEGLLENLEGWVFVDWSEANTFLGQVSFPTNMVYAGMLDAMGKLYHDPDKLDEAEKVREAIRAISYNGKFFVDIADRVHGILKLKDKISEACQYYAYYFGIAGPDTYPAHWEMLVKEFGPGRTSKTPIEPYSEIAPAEFFVSLTMRLRLLGHFGYEKQMLEEIKKYYYDMACETGTLWAYLLRKPDCCSFGFQCYIAYLIAKYDRSID